MIATTVKAGGSVAVIALALAAAPALAQSASSAENSAAAQEASSTEDGDAADIVVTAQKREERLIDVPVSVNSVSSEQLDRQSVYTLGDISRTVPSVSSNLAIRGISTGGVSRSSQGAVAIILDGVDTGPPVIGSPGIANLFDVERVEVLSGPQATLFGTTASAGVINVVTNRPKFDRFEVIGRAEYGNFTTVRNQLTVNVPIAGNAAIRISGQNDETDGIVRNIITNRRPYQFTRGVRGRFLWEPVSALSISLIADYTRIGGNGERNLAFAIAPTPALQARLARCGITASLDNTLVCARGINSIVQKAVKYGFSGQADYDLGGATLTSITAYRRQSAGDLDFNGPGGDSDFLADNILDTNLTAEVQKIFTQEVRLASNGQNTLDYTVGLFYFRKDQFDAVTQAGTLGLVPPPLQIGRVNLIDINQRAYAAFGQATYHVTDRLSLIAGARYTRDELSVVSQSLTATTTPSITSFGYIGSPAFFIAPVNQQANYDNFSWKLGAQYEFSRDLNVYFTATRGYKGPAVNDQASPPVAIPVVEPEIPMNYEFGVKGAFLDGAVLATLAVFRNRVRDFQTSIYVPPNATNPAGSFAQGNAPFVRSQGIDLNITARPTRELNLTAGVLYNDADYSPDFVVACSPLDTRGVGACSAAGTTAPVGQLAGVPKWRLLLNGQYERPISPTMNGYLQGDVTYESDRFAGSTPLPITDIDAQWTLSGRVGLRTADGRWGLGVYGRNLLNTDFSLLTPDFLSGFNGGAGRSFLRSPAKGVQYGVTVDLRF